MAGLKRGPRVLLLGPNHPDSFAVNIAEGFQSLGINAVVFDPMSLLSSNHLRRLHPQLGAAFQELVSRVGNLSNLLIDRPTISKLQETEPTLVISVYSQLAPSQIELWRNKTPNATWVFWYPDAIVNLGNHRSFIAPYDYLFFKEPFLVEKLSKRTRIPVHFLPQACNPNRHRPETPNSVSERNRYECDVAIAGNVYNFRLLVMDAIQDGIDIRIYGNPRASLPERFDRFASSMTYQTVTWRAKSLAFRGAKIVLNTMHYGEIQGINSRLFEATGCGAFVLSHDGPDLKNYFESGNEIATFDRYDELPAAIEHYLAAPEERERIALGGLERTMRDHTYPQRIRELLKVVGRTELLGTTEIK